MYDAFNATFLSLILKSYKPSYFDDYSPISLCNNIYKIISKTIALLIKPILSRMISKEQFAFLSQRQIHEAIGTTQDALHSMKKLHKKSIVLKIDLSKAFDRACWSYLQFTLTHIGFPHAFISWIMCCLSSVSYSILINGAASRFFHVERGLRQGCPLSPLLFILIMEGFSKLIKNGRAEDWAWLIAKIESRINIWQQRWLSRVGRLTLLKSVLEAILDYWMTLAWIPKGILKRIQQIYCRFLWRGQNTGRTFTWVHWDRIGKPKKLGDWGIKNLQLFAEALATKYRKF
eukprot:PITA_21578